MQKKTFWEQYKMPILLLGGIAIGALIGVIAPSNKALGIEKRPIEGFDQPISIGWICQKSYTPSPLAAKFVENLKLLSVDQ